MAWVTPKTDWYGGVNSSTGLYEGDRFNASDYNRIKNNIQYLRDFAITLYPTFTIVALNDKAVGDYYYADEINQIESNFEKLNYMTLLEDYGSKPTYSANGNTPVFGELNRLESAMLDMYEKLNNQKEGLRNFEWNFGMKGGIF